LIANSSQGIGRAIARGTFWVVIARFSVRFLGIISTLILARLLMPADFGLMAMATLVIGLLASLSDLGLAPALVQRKEIDDTYYATAWTLQVLRSVILGAIIYLIAEPVASFYQEAALVNIIKVLSLITVINGFSSIYLVNFQRHMEFEREFRFQIRIKIISFVGTMVAAWIMQSYWALVFGNAVSALGTVIYSYVLFPRWPRLSLSRFATIFHFSNWIFIYQTITYLASKAEVLLLGRLTDPTNIGIYDVSREIATTPISELTLPIARALFPGLARLQHDPSEFARVLLLTFAFIIAIGLPAGLGLAFIANPLINLLFPVQWHGIIPLIQILAIYSVFRMLLGPSISVFMAKGNVRFIATISGVFLPVRLGAIALGWYYSALSGVAIAILGLAVVQAGTMLYSMSRWNIINISELMRHARRSLVAGVAMVLLLTIVTDYCEELLMGPLFEVIIIFLAGAITYLLVHIGLWWLSKCPDGVEALVLAELGKRISLLLRTRFP